MRIHWTTVPAAGGPATVDVRRYAVVGAAMLALCSLVGAGSVWLLPLPAGSRLAGSVVFAVTAAVEAATLLAPWARLPHQFLLLYPVLGTASLAVLGLTTTGVGSVYLGFLVFPFLFMGFSGSTPGVLALLPAGAVTWLLLNGVNRPGEMNAAYSVRLAIGMSVWAVVGLLLARRSTEERHQRSELTDEAHTDPLTGLDNRRVLTAALDAVEVGDVVVVVDIDEFREVNTARGHGGGDVVLAEFGRTVRVALRGGDRAIRQGGDEFVLVLTAVSDVQVLTVLARLRDRWQHVCGAVTFSAGAAAFRPGETGHDTLRRADQHCYRAKAAGRDQWLLDETDPPADPPGPTSHAGHAGHVGPAATGRGAHAGPADSAAPAVVDAGITVTG